MDGRADARARPAHRAAGGGHARRRGRSRAEKPGDHGSGSRWPAVAGRGGAGRGPRRQPRRGGGANGRRFARAVARAAAGVRPFPLRPRRAPCLPGDRDRPPLRAPLRLPQRRPHPASPQRGRAVAAARPPQRAPGAAGPAVGRRAAAALPAAGERGGRPADEGRAVPRGGRNCPSPARPRRPGRADRQGALRRGRRRWRRCYGAGASRAGSWRSCCGSTVGGHRARSSPACTAEAAAAGRASCTPPAAPRVSVA